MDQITLKNFRCFRDKQTARLAPLTLLVGENSTGKTSFMSMVRALWDLAHWEHRVPDFKEVPYDLGSFDEIAHHRGGGVARAGSFEAGFTAAQVSNGRNRRRAATGPHLFGFHVVFEKKGTAPSPVKLRLSDAQAWTEDSIADQTRETSFGTNGRQWTIRDAFLNRLEPNIDRITPPLFFALSRGLIRDERSGKRLKHLFGPKPPNDKELERVWSLLDTYESRFRHYYRGGVSALRKRAARPYASAPVRSKPRRTYDPARPTPDPEGDYVPMYLASMYFQDEKKWEALKAALERFGREAGLFDEISIKPLGKRDSEPFQMQVRKFDGRLKGPKRNLIDVGYGVSQVLPVMTELFRQSAPPMFLLQQPEVHLHPSAQAALGSLFCEIASPQRQLLIETHSDHLLDRVRMDVRDRSTGLKPDDVSILFFERSGLDVQIHSLRIDEEGNIAGAPSSYRKFFMEETTRSLGL